VDAIELISLFGERELLDPEEAQHHLVRGLARVRLDAIDIVAATKAKADGINGNLDLTAPGKRNAMERIYSEKIGEIDALENHAVTRLAKKAAFANAEKAEELILAGDDSDVVGYLREAETRDFLYTVNDLELPAIIESAIEKGDATTIAAVVHAPKVRPLLEGEALETAKEAWLRTSKPEFFAEAEELSGAIDLVEGSLEIARRAVSDIAGVEGTAAAPVVVGAEA